MIKESRGLYASSTVPPTLSPRQDKPLLRRASVSSAGVTGERDLAIRSEGLRKRYRVGRREGYRVLRDALSDAARSPFRGRGERDERYVWALDDVSFDVGRGEIVGVIGPNGAGKSTLLKVLSRITEPTEGQAELYGRVGSLLEVGTGFHPELTGRENIFLNGAILGMSRSEIARKLDDIVEFAGVGRFLDTPLKLYSSGMQVRSASPSPRTSSPRSSSWTRCSPSVISPSSSVLGKMKDVASGGRTVLFVSHTMSSILALCPRAILLGERQGALRRTERGGGRALRRGVADERRLLARRPDEPDGHGHRSRHRPPARGRRRQPRRGTGLRRRRPLRARVRGERAREPRRARRQHRDLGARRARPALAHEPGLRGRAAGTRRPPAGSRASSRSCR